MNIIIIPFHDWRKIIKEGFRTRDAHFIEVLMRRREHRKIIINRPITFLEIFLKKKNSKIEGKLLLREGGFTLYEIEENTYLIDYISRNFLNQIVQRFKWYINNYGSTKYVSFIHKCLSFLDFNDFCLLNQNIFAYKLTEQINSKALIFDAWDNFTKFVDYKSIISSIESGYQSLAKESNFWITNSKENIGFFNKTFSPKSIFLIPNGVDLERFVHNKNTNLPDDLMYIKRPIIGFGGKISQLLDTDLINHIIKNAPDASFVFVGQLLNKPNFDKIVKRSNFYYLGDKHYDAYPNYVKNFDICIVPYVTQEDKKSGANTIKAYEYLSTGKKVVGTCGNGLEELKDYVYLANDASEFSGFLKSTDNNKEKIDFKEHSWEHKVDRLLELIDEETNHV